MTDDLEPSRLLASATLDNEVTADERAQVESTPALRDEMNVYAELRDELGSVEVPAAARESGIAAALAAFDAMAADDGAVTPPTIVEPLRPAARPALAPVVSLNARRQKQMRWLGGAAAAAVVGVLAVGALNSTSSGDSKSSSTVPFASAAKTAEPASAPAAEAADSAASPEMETADSTAASTAETTAAADAPAAESAGGQASDTTPDANTTAAVASADPWAGSQSLVTPEQLVAFATDIPPSVLASTQTPATAAASDTDGGTEPATTTAGSTADTTVSDRVADGAAYLACVTGSGLPSSPAIYRGTRVIVERDDVAGEVLVVDPNGCLVLDRLPLSTP